MPLHSVSRALLAWAVGALLLVALVPAAARFVTTSAGWLDYPYPRAGSEGLILSESLLLKRGGDIYSPITPESFISGPYPPVYYRLAALILPDTLPDFSAPEGVWSVFAGGRIVSLLATLLGAACIVLLALFASRPRRREAVWQAALGGAIGGVIFLSLPQTTVWATRFRGDMLMIALTALGLLAVAAWEPRRRNVQHGVVLYLLAPALFSLAFYTKQTAIAGPAAAAAYLLLRDWRTGLRWAASMFAAVAVPFAALEIATGHWFWLKMVDYHSLPLRESTLTRLLQFAFLEDSWPLLVPALAYALYRLWVWLRSRGDGDEQSRKGVSILAPVFLLASLVTLPTGAVVGADHNHLLMPGLAISAAVGAACARLLTEIGGGRFPAAQWALGALVIAAVPLYGLGTSEPSSWYEPDLAVPSAQVQEQMRKIVHNLSTNPGTLFFSDDPGIVALAGKQTPYDDPFTMTALALQGRWDESAYREMLREGRFGLLVLSCNVIEAPEACRHDTFSPGVREAISQGYRVLFRDVLVTYAPRE